MTIRTIIFDFGGVLADEGFRDGLRAIGLRHGLDPERAFLEGRRGAFEGGYASGRMSEAAFWAEFRRRTGVDESDEALRAEILRRFRPRPEVLDYVRELGARGYALYVLSDQTNWLDELEAEHGFFHLFRRVFNSYHMGKTKLDPSIFPDVCLEVGIAPREAVFVDDSEGNVGRARSVGMRAVLYTNPEALRLELESIVGAGGRGRSGT